MKLEIEYATRLHANSYNANEPLRKAPNPMELRLREIKCSMAAIAAAGVIAQSASAFIVGDRWTATASGSAGFRGDPITLTWSIVPDGTTIPNLGGSSFIGFFDDEFGQGPGDDALSARRWFPLIESAFARWSELGGVTFAYEPHDDGAGLRSAPGLLGVRGDVRLAAADVDGPGGTLGFSQFPDTGDIVLDVGDANRLANPQGDYLRLRNTLMHEIGHVLGLEHVDSRDAALLMEPALTTAFDGPQIDEIRGLHYLYGDRWEPNSHAPPDGDRHSPIELGMLAPGDSIRLGEDAEGAERVSPAGVDFLSISGRSDVDLFSFEVLESARVNIDLKPRGGVYRQSAADGPEHIIDAAASSDLLFELFVDDGSVVASVDRYARGSDESLVDFQLPSPGRYLIRVAGRREIVQLYELAIHVAPAHVPEPTALAISACAIFAVAMLKLRNR